MRILCLERDNVTQLCDPDSDGDVYTSSFELFPFHEGATFSLYMGVYNGNGPYAGQFCTVRCLLDLLAGPSHWQRTLDRAREAQRLAHEFNKELAYPAVFFNVPVLTRMERVSDFNALFRCFRPHDKRLKQGEYVTLEPYLEGNFRQFDQPTNNRLGIGWTSPAAGEPDIIEHIPTAPVTIYATKHKNIHSSSSIAHAFSHFTWHVTGSHIICGLQGVLSGLTYTLTNPQIHSVGASFGTSDGSVQAITDFFRTHKCNNICRGWDRYIPDRNSLPQVNFLRDSSADSCHIRQPCLPQQHGFRHNDVRYYKNCNKEVPSAPEHQREENSMNSYV
ncbi:alpha-protein kinase vwka [Plakobranchus ocellatus]|uniref:Alpha-protein kinase vwka n=1 Tax=Plakobranchus ocellatus TaxID=259542 RepID=A0AAV4BQQ6_9GAST|nr:alpha-protein kinase vwka [Plakobranchus ocellatus]